jgi:S-formylglutathione hydrolase FrmB
MARFDVTFSSYSLFRDVEITVIVPSMTIVDMMNANGAPVHHGPAAPFSVVYLLHGFGNNRNGWLNYTNVQMYAEERHIAIVTISAENKAYLDQKADRFFRFVSEELPEFVTGMFPISKRPEDTYIAGLSMGGYGSYLHGLTHPEKYRAIGTFSAGVSIDPGTFAKSAFAKVTDRDPQYDLYAIAEKVKEEGKKFPKIYASCGKKDALYQSCLDYAEKLKELGADVTWDEMEQYGHEWRFWDAQVEKFLDWIPRDDYYAKLGKRSV